MTVSEREEVSRRLALNARLPAIDVLLHALFDLAERPTPETAPQLFDADQVMNPLSFDDDGKITAHRLRPPTEWFTALSKIELTATPQPELRQAIPGLKVVTPPRPAEPHARPRHQDADRPS
jgi:hypothetical protein